MNEGKIKERPILFSAPMVRALLRAENPKTQTRRVVKHEGCQCGEWEPEEMCATTPEGWQTSGHSGRWWCKCCTSNEDAVNCPYGKPGDRLWVRETWGLRGARSSYEGEWSEHAASIAYQAGAQEREFVRTKDEVDALLKQRPRRADETDEERNEYLSKYWKSWRPSIHMPRWASRILLEVVSVRVERLEEISEADALAEGVVRVRDGCHVIRGFDYDLSGLCHTSAITPFEKLWHATYGEYSWAANPWVWVVEFKRVMPGRAGA